MESNDELFYDQLDLDPFTFSSPNSTGWNDVELKNLIENVIHSEDIEIPQSTEQNIKLLELFVNDSEVFSQLQQQESIQFESNNLNPTLEQDWRQPLPNPPLLQSDDIVNDHHLMNTIHKQGNLHERYIKWLSYLQAHHNIQNIKPSVNKTHQHHTSSSHQNNINEQHSIPSRHHSSKTSQKISNVSFKNESKRAAKSLPSRKITYSHNQSYIQIIQQLNKQTMEKLQNR